MKKYTKYYLIFSIISILYLFTASYFIEYYFIEYYFEMNKLIVIKIPVLITMLIHFIAGISFLFLSIMSLFKKKGDSFKKFLLFILSSIFFVFIFIFFISGIIGCEAGHREFKDPTQQEIDAVYEIR